MGIIFGNISSQKGNIRAIFFLRNWLNNNDLQTKATRKRAILGQYWAKRAIFLGKKGQYFFFVFRFISANYENQTTKKGQYSTAKKGNIHAPPWGNICVKR